MNKTELYKAFLENFCKNLTLTTFPHAQELMFRNIFLDEIFYEIDVVEGKATKGFSLKDIRPPADFDVDELLRRIDERIKELEAELENEKQDSSTIVINSKKNRRILITGSAGSGKSILLKRFVLGCLNLESETSVFLEKYKKILDNNILRSVPVFIILNKLQFISKEELELRELSEILYNLSCAAFGEDFYSKISAEDFKDILSSEKTTLFLDGLDEVLEAEKKSLFLSKLDSEKEKYDIVITTRIEDSDDNESFFEDAEYFRIAEFNMDFAVSDRINLQAVEGFAKNFYKVMFKFNPPEQEKYKDFIKHLSNSPLLQKMIKTPFTLSLILSLFISGQSLTENRAELSRNYVDLYLSWYSNKERENCLSKSTIIIMLSYIALYMVKNQRLMLDDEELSLVLSACYRDMDGHFPDKMNVSDINVHIKELINVGILDNHLDKYSFSQHRLLLEYFAAFAISEEICDYETYSLTPLEFFSDKLTNPKWKEVVLYFCLMQPRETPKIVNNLISAVEKIEDNYYQGNLLFELSTEAPMRTSERHKVYDVLFREHITDRQIHLILLLLASDSVIAEDFINYIEEKFEESVNKLGERPYYNYAYAISICYIILKREMDPLLEAEKMLQSSELTDVILGLEIYTILAWCRYMNIENMFSFESNTYKMYDRAIQSFKTLVRNIDSFAMPGVIARAFQECVIAGFVSFSDIVDYDLYKKIVSDFSRNTDKEYLWTILSAFDFSYSPKDISISDKTKKVAFDKLIKKLEEKNQNAVFDFSVCASMGVFRNSFFEEICKIFEKDKSDSMSRAWFLCLNKILTVFKTIRDGIDEDQFAIEYFNYQLSDEGKRYFNNLSDDEPIEKLTFNLSYYLRRGELKKVYKDQIPTSPINLLYGDMVGDVASIIEHALILSGVSKNDFGDLNLGYCYLESEEKNLTKNHDALLQSLKYWPVDNRFNEAENIIVSYWLWRLCILDIEDLPPVDYLLDRIIMNSKLCTQIFDFVVELTRYSEYFISKTIQKLQNSLPDVIEVETCVLEDDEEYFVLKEFMVNDTEYTCFVSLVDYSDFFFRKTVIEDGEEYICGLEDDREFDLAYTNFLKILLSDIGDL